MLRLYALLARRLAHRRGYALLSGAAIALGVALGFAVAVVHRAAVEELASGVRAIAGEADLVVRAERASGFREELYAQLARAPLVAVAAPILELDVPLAPQADRGGVARGGPLRLIGLDPLRQALVQPALFADDPARRFALLAADAVWLSAAAARHLDLEEGSVLRLVAGLSVVELRVAGVLPEAALGGIAVIADVATVQWRFARTGELNRVDLRLAPGADRAVVRERLSALLPPGVHVLPVDAVEESAAALSRAYRVNLEVLAAVALVTGGFLVFSAIALETARRRGEHALLRALGLERRGLRRLLLVEAGLLGAVGGALGLGLGWLLALAALRSLGADLGAGFFRGVAPQPAFPPALAVLYLGAAVAATLAGAAVPAAQASRLPVAQALKAGDFAAPGDFRRMWPAGLALCGCGAALALAPALDGIPVFGYGAIGALLVGGVLLVPRFADALYARLPASPSPAWLLALAQLRGAPGVAAVSLAALVASFSLTAAMAIMVASFRSSVERWLHAVLPAELYFRTASGETAWFDEDLQERVRTLPQIARAEFVRIRRIEIAPGRPPVSLLARDATESGALHRFPRVGPEAGGDAGDPPPVWISEAVADLHGWRPGARVPLPLGERLHEFRVAGVYRDYARQHGSMVIARTDYVARTGDRRANDAALWLAPGAAPADAIAALRALPGGALLEISGAGEVRAASLRLFDRTFAITYALEAIAVLIGLAGLSASMAANAVARRREFGLLRHLGITRGGVLRLLALEGTLLAAPGIAAGLALGAAMSLVLVHVVNRQSFHWSMELEPPLLLLAALTAAVVGLASASAALAGREAAGAAAVRAVKEDW